VKKRLSTECQDFTSENIQKNAKRSDKQLTEGTIKGTISQLKGRKHKMKTRTEKLTQKINEIVKGNKTELSKLNFNGPKGGHNARNINGWESPGIAAISRAANLSGNCPTMNWWSGSCPTPSLAIPSCISFEIKAAWREIFGDK
jgi:hypothetical protein